MSIDKISVKQIDDYIRSFDDVKAIDTMQAEINEIFNLRRREIEAVKIAQAKKNFISAFKDLQEVAPNGFFINFASEFYEISGGSYLKDIKITDSLCPDGPIAIDF